MKAAVVSSFDTPPRYGDVPVPTAERDHDLVVDVIAAGLHPRVRSQADGSHYTSTDQLPLVPGIDGVGRGADGLLRYFILPDTTKGSMAQQTVVDTRRSVVLPDASDPLAVAAGMNPAMSSWVALRRRVAFEPGQNVLVLGATGNAGRMAVQVARLLGAQQVIASGRGAARLASLATLGATAAARSTPTSWALPAPRSTWCSTTSGASRPPSPWPRSSRNGRTGPAPALDPDRVGRRRHGTHPLGRAPRRPAPDRRQRPGLGRHRGDHRGAPRAGRGDQRRHVRRRRPPDPAGRCRAGVGRAVGAARRPHAVAVRGPY